MYLLVLLQGATALSNKSVNGQLHHQGAGRAGRNYAMMAASAILLTSARIWISCLTSSL
jgi:hypothetical protein